MPKETFVTLVGKSYAYEGFKFYFSKPRTDICPKSCRFFNPCMKNLPTDKIYVITEVMGIEHKCPSDYHDEPMKLVKVQESDIEILIESRSTFLGAITKYAPIACKHKNCPYKAYCTPIKGVKPGIKLRIVEIIKKIKDNECNKNFSLVRVEKVLK